MARRNTQCRRSISTSGVSLSHNLWDLPDVPSPFLWGATTYDHAEWGNATGHADGDVTSEPTFVGPWELPVENLRLLEDSPAVDSGTALAEVTDDFSGGARPSGSGYDLGAFEFGAEPAGGGGPGAGGETGASGAAGGANSGSGASDAEAAGDASEDRGGCGCRLPRGYGGNSRAPLGVVLALTLVCLGRRGREHTPVAATER